MDYWTSFAVGFVGTLIVIASYAVLACHIANLKGELSYAKAQQKDTADRLQDTNDNYARTLAERDVMQQRNKKLSDELQVANRRLKRIEDAVEGKTDPVITSTTSAR